MVESDVASPRSGARRRAVEQIYNRNQFGGEVLSADPGAQSGHRGLCGRRPVAILEHVPGRQCRFTEFSNLGTPRCGSVCRRICSMRGVPGGADRRPAFPRMAFPADGKCTECCVRDRRRNQRFAVLVDAAAGRSWRRSWRGNSAPRGKSIGRSEIHRECLDEQETDLAARPCQRRLQSKRGRRGHPLPRSTCYQTAIAGASNLVRGTADT